MNVKQQWLIWLGALASLCVIADFLVKHVATP